jgi:hypothetical protein
VVPDRECHIRLRAFGKDVSSCWEFCVSYRAHFDVWEQFIFTMVVVRAVVINTGLPKDLSLLYSF